MVEPVSGRDALHDHTVALGTTAPASDGGGLDELCDVLADARIVGLGEGTHGTREFFELKHRIVRELVETHGLRTFAIEAAIGDARGVNDYVRDGEGTPEAAVGSLRSWTLQTEEMLAFVEWFREFNRGRDRDDKVEFWGVDVQFATGSAEAVATYLDETPGVGSVDGLDALAEDGLRAETLDDDHLTRAEDVTAAVVDHLETNRDALVAATGERAWTIARQHARTMEQTVELATRKTASDDERDGPAADAVSYRDRAMAENATWLLEGLGATQVALWAHNAHVNRSGMTWTDHEQSIPSLGNRLAERHGDDYHPLGFAFGRGSFQAFGPLPADAERDRGVRSFTVDRPTQDSLEATLASLERDVVALRLDDARTDDDLDDWMSVDHDVRSIGALYSHDDADDYWTTLDLERDFDTVVYVDETTRARPLGRE